MFCVARFVGPGSMPSPTAPEGTQNAVQRLTDLARTQDARQHDPSHPVGYVGIEVEVTDDDQFDLLVALSPFTINAEGYTEADDLIYSASDTGTGLWMQLTPTQHEELVERLRASGANPRCVARR
ncbi:hypothetical protein GCM10023317_40510 [Actinopolymorpha pittospori]